MNGQILELGIGILLLFLGRKLFWLFVGVVGFLSGIQFAPQFLPTENYGHGYCSRFGFAGGYSGDFCLTSDRCLGGVFGWRSYGSTRLDSS
jgi:hypothetical protein